MTKGEAVATIVITAKAGEDMRRIMKAIRHMLDGPDTWDDVPPAYDWTATISRHGTLDEILAPDEQFHSMTTG